MQTYCNMMGWFWRQYPALLYGLSLYFGFTLAFTAHWSLLIPLSILAIPILCQRGSCQEKVKGRLLLSLLLSIAAFTYAACYYQFPNLSEEEREQGVKGSGPFIISSISKVNNHFGSSWAYQGSFRYFIASSSGEITGRHIPCTLHIKEQMARPAADREYYIEGRLLPSKGLRWILKINHYSPWYAIPGSWNFAEYRFLAKQAAQKAIFEHIEDPHTAAFLSGMLIGEFQDRGLSFSLGRLGLQHLMAISGFHFALIGLLLSLLIRPFLSAKKAALTIILLLTSYYLLVGGSPSVERAWITILIFLAGQLFERKSSSLNSLGVALMLVTLKEPTHCLHLGFQFSFLSTAAILLFYGAIDRILQKTFTKRPLSHMVEMDSLNQHGYLFLCFFRQAAALTFAVHLTTIPVMLYSFHKFPLLSLVYNLIFPFLASFSLLLVLVALGGSLVLSPLGDGFYFLAELYTNFILKMTLHAPMTLDFSFRVEEFPLALFVSYLSLLFLAGIWWHFRQKQKIQELIF